MNIRPVIRALLLPTFTLFAAVTAAAAPVPLFDG
jgi:hypothetical protein